MEWKDLSQPSEHFGPAWYEVRLADAKGCPIPLGTIFGAMDPSGIVSIGESLNLEKRRMQMLNGTENCYGHPSGNLWFYLKEFTKLLERFPGCRLQYRYQPAQTKHEAESLECAAIKSYVVRHGQMPLLNRQIPSPYDDNGWNQAWQSVFGAEGSAPAPSRVAGLHAGAITTTGDFDAPLPDDFWAGTQ